MNLLENVSKYTPAGTPVTISARTVNDTLEVSVADEAASGEFADADRDSIVLKQVRDALARVDNGTFGACLVDGGPIEEKRLDAVPWTPYCVKHERLIEAANLSGTPPPA